MAKICEVWQKLFVEDALVSRSQDYMLQRLKNHKLYVNLNIEKVHKVPISIHTICRWQFLDYQHL